MADLARFHQEVQRLLKERGVTQRELAERLFRTQESLNRQLRGKNSLKDEDVRSIVKALAKLDTIHFKHEVQNLLDVMECSDFTAAEWASTPLSELSSSRVLPSAAALSVHQDNQPDSLQIFPFFEVREYYLKKLISRYGFVSLPLGRSAAMSLQDVFQPLKLRQGALLAEELPFEERRALLDEPTLSEDDPRYAGEEHLLPEQRQQLSSIVIVNSGEEAIENSSKGRLVILGHPGSGKTTLLKDLIRKTAERALEQENTFLPLFISLPDLAKSAATLQHYLPVLLGNLGVDERYAPSMWEEIQEERAFLCLDGLDEVAPHTQRDIVNWLNIYAEQAGNVWVVSSRFSEYRSGLLYRTHFTEWELQFLTVVSRRKLVQQLLPVVTKQFPFSLLSPRRDAARFLKALAKHPQASTWGKNPLLLSLCVVVFVSVGTIPASRTELYEQVINAVLKTHLPDSLHRDTVRRVAAALAFALHQQKRRVFMREELLLLLPEIRGQQRETWSTEEIARDLLRSGLLEVVAEETYGIWHQTYQEYLAARALAERFSSQQVETREWAWRFAWERRTYNRWNDVLCLLIGILVRVQRKESTSLALNWVHTLAAQEAKGDIGDFNLALALRTLGEVQEKKIRWNRDDWVQLQKEVSRGWLARFTDTVRCGHELRQARLLSFAENLSQFHSSIVSNVIKELTKAAAADLRMSEMVLRVFGKLGMHAPVQQLLHSLQDQHDQIRKAAIQSLAELDAFVRPHLLIKALRNSEAMTREAAMEAAKVMQDNELVAFFFAGLQDTDWQVRLTAVEALTNYLEERGVPDRLLACLDDEEAFVRAAVIEALGKLDQQIPFDRLLNMLEDPSHIVRGAAIQVLGEQTPIEKLTEEVDIPEAQTYYSYAYQPALEILAQLEEKLSPAERSDAVQSTYPHRLLHRVRDFQQEASDEELIQALYDIDKAYNLSAARLLGKKQNWASLEQFIIALQNSHGYFRAIAISLLSRLKERVPTKLFVASLRDSYSQVRLEAIRALEHRDDLHPEDAEQIATLLDDKDRRIRAAALRILNQVIPHIDIELPLLEKLFQALQSDFRSIAQPASMILKTVGSRVSTEQRAALFHHPDPQLRLNAVTLLAPYASIGQIAEILDDAEAIVRAEALRSLSSRYMETVPLELVTNFLKDPDPMVYDAAIDVLKSLDAQEILKDVCDEDGFPKLPPELLQDEIEEHTHTSWHTNKPNELYDFVRLLGDNYGKTIEETDINMDEITIEAWGTQYSYKELIRLFEDGNDNERRNALYTLGDNAPQETLFRALNDNNWEVRKAGLIGLGKRASIEQLLNAFGDEYEMVRDVAIKLVQDMGEDLPKALLLELLKHQKSDVRASAIRALGKYNPLKNVIDALGDSEEEVRTAALETLRDQHPEVISGVLDDLTAVMTGSGPNKILASAARSFIAETIGALEDAPASFANQVTELLEWPYWEVRMKAAQALGKLRSGISEKAVNRLRVLREDVQEPQSVRTAADDALAEILSLELNLENDK